MKLEANAKRQLDKASKDGKVKGAKPAKSKKEPVAVKSKDDGGASEPASSSKDPKVLVAYLEEQLKSAPDMLVAYLGEQLKQAKDAVAAASAASREPVEQAEDASSSDGSSAMSESDSDSDAPPEETSIRPTAPVSVPPPKREAPKARTKQICQNFQKGRCKYGGRCRNLHERKPKAAPKEAPKPPRKSLHEVVSVCPTTHQYILADINLDGGE